MSGEAAQRLAQLRRDLDYTKRVRDNPNDPAQVEWATARIPRLETEITRLEAQPMQLRLAELETARQDELGL